MPRGRPRAALTKYGLGGLILFIMFFIIWFLLMLQQWCGPLPTYFGHLLSCFRRCRRRVVVRGPRWPSMASAAWSCSSCCSSSGSLCCCSQCPPASTLRPSQSASRSASRLAATRYKPHNGDMFYTTFELCWPCMGSAAVTFPGSFVDCTHTHTHTHTFNGPLSRTTRVSRYQKCKTNLDFTEARDSEW